MNKAYMLPDAYAKSENSNNYKLLDLAAEFFKELNADLEAISDSRDYKKATGKSLDRIGEKIGLPRSGATDEQYRMKIASRIGRLNSDGSCDATIKIIADIIGCEPEDISIKEGDMSVEIKGLSIKALQTSGYKSSEVTSIIKDVLPIGVGLKPPVYAGTLLLMGETKWVEYETGSPKSLVAIGADGNYQYPVKYGQFHPAYNATLPTLQAAYNLGQWYYQTKHDGLMPDGCLDVGLAGEANYPEDGIIYGANGTWLGYIEVGVDSFEWLADHTYKGGTLGLSNGEDE